MVRYEPVTKLDHVQKSASTQHCLWINYPGVPTALLSSGRSKHKSFVTMASYNLMNDVPSTDFFDTLQSMIDAHRGLRVQQTPPPLDPSINDWCELLRNVFVRYDQANADLRVLQTVLNSAPAGYRQQALRVSDATGIAIRRSSGALRTHTTKTERRCYAPGLLKPR